MRRVESRDADVCRRLCMKRNEERVGKRGRREVIVFRRTVASRMIMSQMMV